MTTEPKMPPLPVQFHDHPDIVGGVKWSDCELRWISARDRQWAERVRELEKALRLAKEALDTCSVGIYGDPLSFNQGKVDAALEAINAALSKETGK